MESTSNIRTLQINGMTGDACVDKVKKAIQSVNGITLQAVRVGSATVRTSSPAQYDAACAAVVAAGYTIADTAIPAVKASNDMANEGAGGANQTPPKPSKIVHSASPVTGKPPAAPVSASASPM